MLERLARLGHRARQGQWVEASLVPVQRNARAENAAIKAGEVPEGWDTEAAKSKRRQKDVEARWTRKQRKHYYGYKNHVNVDREHKLIRQYAVSAANVHDSQRLDT